MFNRLSTNIANRRFVMRALHHARFLIVIPLLTTALVACGDDDSPSPTATSLAPTATTVAGTATAATPSVPSSPVASPAAGTLTAGDLADRMTAAWSNVTSYRARTTTSQISTSGTPASAASPAAGPVVVETIAEAILPDQKHWVSQTNGEVQYEFIAVDGRIYGRGALIPGRDSSNTDPNSWVEIDPATVEADSVFATLITGLQAPARAPYSSLSPEVRSRDAVPVEPRTVDDQTCAAYRLADTTETGERIEITIALTADNLPCLVETRAGGLQTVTTYTYNLPFTITAPIAATPTAGSS